MTATLEAPRTEPDQPSGLSGGTPLTDRIFKGVAVAAGTVVLVILGLIAWSMTKQAWPWFHKEGLKSVFGTRWAPSENVFGALSFIYGTLVTAVIAIVLALPVSIGIALFVTEVAPGWLRRPVVYVMDLLAVIPSVVFGLWGVATLAPFIKGFYQDMQNWLHPIPVLNRVFTGVSGGKSFFTAGIILAVMITPIITTLIREVFNTVPPGDKEGAYAMGATRWEMIRGAVFPHSRGGMVGSVMLGLGRAMGETIAAALVIGSSHQITSKLFGPGDSMPAVIANEFGESSGTYRAALIGLGVVLFAITIIVNIAARAIVTRSIRRSQGATA